MSTSTNRLLRGLIAALCGLGLLLPTAAAAHPEVTGDPAHDEDGAHDTIQERLESASERDPDSPLENHDDATDETPPPDHHARPRKTLDLVGRGERLLPEGTTDVWVHGAYAYLGTFNNPCGDGTGANGSGIPVFDVRNPNRPREIGRIPSVQGSRINDVKVGEIGRTDILVHSNEPCDGGPGGFEIYNVNNPRNPVHLASVRTGDVNTLLREQLGIDDVGVHNLFLFSQGDRTYVAAVVESIFGNFQIFDITDPAAPTMVGFWGAEQLALPGVDWVNLTDPAVIDEALAYLLDGFGDSQNRFLHDITVDHHGESAYLSNWDAGLVLLDISDVTDPTLVSVAIDPVNGSLDGEVNSHAAWPSEDDGRVVVETEEDFNAIVSRTPPGNFTFGDSPNNTIPGVAISTFAGDELEANPVGNTATVDAETVTITAGPLAGTVYPAAELSGNQPRLADVGPVSGEAVFVGRACNGDSLANADQLDAGDIAVVRRGACTFAEKLANVAAAGAGAIVIANNQRNDTPWGGVRIWDYSDPSNPVLADTFYTECSADPFAPGCDPRGTYTVHNVIVEGDRAYISWYSDGVVVLDISDPYDVREIARYNETGPAFEAANGGIQDVWGIYKVDNRPFIYASDRNGGLYVLKLKGRGQGGAPHPHDDRP